MESVFALGFSVWSASLSLPRGFHKFSSVLALTEEERGVGAGNVEAKEDDDKIKKNKKKHW